MTFAPDHLSDLAKTQVEQTIKGASAGQARCRRRRSHHASHGEHQQVRGTTTAEAITSLVCGPHDKQPSR